MIMTKLPNHKGRVAHAEPGTVSNIAVSAGARRHRGSWEMAEAVLTEPRQWIENRKRGEGRHGEGRRRPLIGVNCDVVCQNGLTYCWLPDTYRSCLAAAGADVLILPVSPLPAPSLPSLLAILDGLVMIGGRDLDPRNDGYQLHRAHRLMDPRREKFDRELVKQAEELGLPLLAIGAGLQTLNVVLGGTLAYHIPEDYRHALSHYEPEDPHHGHPIYCREGSLCAAIYPNVLVAHVRSQHHQAVDDVAPGFVVTAWAGKVAEAIECTIAGWPAIGVQWHPEFPTALETDRLIFEYFVQIARQFKRG
jgi:putative glutamine amidotransferase